MPYYPPVFYRPVHAVPYHLLRDLSYSPVSTIYHPWHTALTFPLHIPVIALWPKLSYLCRYVPSCMYMPWPNLSCLCCGLPSCSCRAPRPVFAVTSWLRDMSSVSCRDVPSFRCRAPVTYLLWHPAATCRQIPDVTYRPVAAVPPSCICCDFLPRYVVLFLPWRTVLSLLCPRHVSAVACILPGHVVLSLAWRTVLSPMVRTVQGRWVVCPMTAVMLSEEPSVSNSGFTLLKLAVFRKCWNTPEKRKRMVKKRNYHEKRIIFLRKVKEMHLFSNRNFWYQV